MGAVGDRGDPPGSEVRLRYRAISGWSAISTSPTTPAIRSLASRIPCFANPQRARVHSMPSMLITLGIARSRGTMSKTPVL